ncbi:gex interacting protein 16 [Loa loa]|uniref:Gex interacting protein 16 n=1 Tax=Loa loa TaxID=7209 RepID=A0A1I7W2Q0_LOALO|nr:gex interacting protein 16 [Loa loa]EFO17661.1 gex interacting protein 16 [Loa loa]
MVSLSCPVIPGERMPSLSYPVIPGERMPSLSYPVIPGERMPSLSYPTHKVNSNFDYPSELVVPLQNRSDTVEFQRSYSNDTSKQPKSILKQRSVSLLSPSSSNINDNSYERYVERVHINDSNDKEEKQQHHDQSYDRCGRMSQSSQSSNPSPDSFRKENRLYHVMQENLRQQNLVRPQTPRHLPQASFNGPFFTLEEVHTKQQRGSLEMHQIPIEECHIESDYHLIRKQQHNSSDNSSHKLRCGNRSKSVSVMELNTTEHEKNNEIGESVIPWSSSLTKHEHERARSVPPSLRTRNITDPERIDEYNRQKKLELEAMRRREKEAIFWGEKQNRALEIQERLYYQQMHAKQNRTSPELSDSVTQSHEELRQIDMNAQKRQKELYFETSQEPQLMHVYETRPITAISEDGKQPEFICSPNSVTWKRLYIVDQSKPVAKNEIITSEQLLEKERFDIDLLKRREVFIEKPTPEPVIFRTGKRWKPPPEQSYVWPYIRKALNAEPSLESSSNYSTDNAAGRTVENTEFQWQPVIHDPEYKQEHKNFTPENSLLDTQRGFGAGSLDEPAKRQIKYLVQPLPDGSHRPKPAFGGPRVTPSGGFYPHAPNAIKILKKKHFQSIPEPTGTDPDKEVEIIHQRRFHRLGELPPTITSSHCYDIADWEKIYDLPAHSSTITSHDTPRNVNVQGKLAAFENRLRQTTPLVHLRLNSGDTRRPLPSTRTLQSSNNEQINRNGQYIRQERLQQQQQLLSPTSARTDTTDSSHRSYQQQRNERHLISSNGSLTHHMIDHRNMNRSNRTCSTIHPNSYHHEMISSSKLSHPIRNHPEYNRHQHRIPIFRSGRKSAPSHHQQLIQPGVPLAMSRRLTRIPMGFTTDGSNPKVIEVERLPSRTTTITHW